MTINLKVPDIRELKPRITVFGVGGAGGNAVNNMIELGLQGCEFVVGNTDAQALTIAEALTKAGVPLFAYGSFLTVALNFIILAFIIFLMIKQINRLKRAEPAPAPAEPVTPEDIVLLREIRDSLKR